MKISAVLLLAVMTACGAVTAAPTPPRSSDSHGAVIVTTETRPGVGGAPLHVEGAVEEVVLLDGGGDRVIHEARDGWEIVNGPSHWFTDLEPGDYTLEAGLRPCGGSCDHLGRRSDHCSAAIPVGNRRVHVEIRFRIGAPCVIRIHA